MKRYGWPAVAMTVVLWSVTVAAEDVTWKAAAPAKTTPAPTLFKPTSVVKEKSAAEIVWKASSTVATSLKSSAEAWTPAGLTSSAEIEWRASGPVVNETRSLQAVEPSRSWSLATFKPDVPAVEVRLPEPPTATPMPNAIEPPAAPMPKVVDPSKAPPVIVPQKAPLPTPVEKPVFVATPSMSSDESISVWGGYNLGPRTTTLPGTQVPCSDSCADTPPLRHGTFGSQSLRLSRDYHFLDGTHKVMNNEKSPKLFDAAGTEAVAETVVDNSFFSAEYLMWWVNNGDIPVLATTASNRMFGYLGSPGTTALLGPGEFGQSQRNGVRVRGGTWLDDCQKCGLDGSIFVLGSQSNSVAFDSNQFPTIARPFFSPNFGAEFAELVAFPGLATGRLVVDQESFLWGADVNYRRSPACGCEWFAGFRYLNLQENLTINEYITAGANAPDPAGTTIVVQDKFEVNNNFYGGQVGGQAGRRYGNFTLDVRGSLALGATIQTLTISGFQTKTLPGQPAQSFTGGLLAVGPNLGEFTRSRFSVVPEATFSIGYFVLPNLKAIVGYNLLGWTNVIRPGDQIDRVVDLTFVPNAPNVPYSGQPRPQPTFTQSDIFIQGIQFGLEGRW